MALPATLASSTATIPVPRVLGVVPLMVRLGLGKPVMRLFLRRMRSQRTQASAFAGYVPAPYDVFVTTFGKSGTNWMMQIAQQIAHRGAAEFEHIHHVVPWPESPVGVPVPVEDASERERAPTGLRVIKTHLPPGFVPYSQEATYLTIIRDPKEVIVSSYYFLVGLVGALPYVSIEDWFAMTVSPESLAGAWAVHTAGFWAWRDRPNVLVVTYREVKEDPNGCITRVADAMGVKLEPSEFESVVERSSFAYMKRHESKFAPPRLPFVTEADRPKMVRSGQSGASGELLSAAQQVAIDELCQDELQRLGSDFPYATAFHLAGR